MIALVLLFDACSLLAPALMGMPIAPGGTFTVGVVFALLIVLAAIASAVYYVRHLNREDSMTPSSQGPRTNG